MRWSCCGRVSSTALRDIEAGECYPSFPRGGHGRQGKWGFWLTLQGGGWLGAVQLLRWPSDLGGGLSVWEVPSVSGAERWIPDPWMHGESAARASYQLRASGPAQVNHTDGVRVPAPLAGSGSGEICFSHS